MTDLEIQEYCKNMKVVLNKLLEFIREKDSGERRGIDYLMSVFKENTIRYGEFIGYIKCELMESPLSITDLIGILGATAMAGYLLGYSEGLDRGFSTYGKAAV